MKVRGRSCLVVILIFLGVCLSAEASERSDLTLEQLFKNPGRFNGKRVAVVGYYVAGFEESSLYPNVAAAKSLQLKSSVWVEADERFNLDRLTHRFVRVVGTFRYTPVGADGIRGSGHMGLSPGELSHISYFRPIR